LDLSKKNPQIKISIKPHQNKPLVKHQAIVMILAIACSTPMDPLTVAPVKLGFKKVDHAEVIWLYSSKNNVILHVNVV